MKKYMLLFFLLLVVSVAQAKEYGNYDPMKMLTTSETSSGKKHGLDMVYLDLILHDLSVHAKNYPPRFDSPQGRQRAVRDVRMLSGMLDILVNDPSPNREILLRAGQLNSIGHNLDIVGSAQKTNVIFKKLLRIDPSDPQANYMYGTFLSGVGKPNEALPYLEKALAAGVENATYAIGMTYLSLGEKEKALKNLKTYKRLNPNDGNVGKLIEAISNGKIEIKRNHG